MNVGRRAGCGRSGSGTTGYARARRLLPLVAALSVLPLSPLVGAAAAPEKSTSGAAAQQVVVRAYFLKGEKLAVSGRSVPVTRAVARAALLQLLSGPDAADRARSLTSAVPAGTRLLGVSVAGGTATVDLDKNFAKGGGSLSMTSRLAQVVFTVTQFPTVNRVVFEMNGTVVKVFGGEGIILDRPVTRSSFERLAPAILVESPTPGQKVSSPLRASGSANVFEAVFQAALIGPSGRVLAQRTVHASSGTGTRGTFSVTLPYTSSKQGSGYLLVYDLSPRDGSREHISRVPVMISRS